MRTTKGSGLKPRLKLKSILSLSVIMLLAGGLSISASTKNDAATTEQQQTKRITGTVVDAQGEGLIGASVGIQGTSRGTVTDVNGKFTLEASEGETLKISYIGYTEQTVKVGSQTDYQITMAEDAAALEEVVVTALGIKRDARALGYAISSIKGDALTTAGVTANPLAALYGKAAGVGIQSTAAGPTGGVKIKIRGAASLNPSQSVRPLFVVDGVPIYDTESSMASRGYDPLNSFDYGSGINDVNPEDIESMEILKGAKASVLYGSAGANGVVLITTKSGKRSQGLGIQVSYGHEWEKPRSMIDFQNEFGSGQNEYSMSYTDDAKTQRKTVSDRFNFGPRFDGTPIQFFDGSIAPYQAYKNNYMDMFQTGSSDNVTIALAGGNEKGNARMAYTNYNYNGIMANSDHQKNTLSFNGSLRPSEIVTFDFTQNLYLTKTKNRRQNMQQSVAWGTFNRDYDIKRAMKAYKDENGQMIDKEILKGDGWPTAFISDSGGLFDMFWNQFENANLDSKVHSITAAKANFQFLPYLALRFQGGIDYTTTDYAKHDKVLRQRNGAWEGGKFKYDVEETMIQNYEGFITFTKDLLNDDMHIDAFAGGAYKRIDYTKTTVGTIGNFIFPDYWSVSNTDGWPSSFDSRVANYNNQAELVYSALGQATVSWKNKYFVEFQARNDWASTLPKVNRSYFYPGVSFTWDFTNDFNIPKINYGKFRLSWADVGRPAPRYYALNTYYASQIPTYPGLIDIRPGTSDNSNVILFSGDLKPERKREIETGFDLRFFENDRIGIDFSYYYNTIYDQIMAIPLSGPTGANEIRINAGEVRNQGIEMMLKGKPVYTSKYRWELSLSMARQWDKIVKLYPGISQVNDTQSEVHNRAVVGERMGNLYLRDYVRDPQGNRVVGSNGLYSLSGDSKDEICVGNINPDLYGGLQSNFSILGNWGAVNIMFGLDYKFGGKILSYSNVYLKGNGLTTNSLAYRDGANGGLTWTETLADKSTRERHDGLILPGVKNVGTADAPQYVENDQVVSAYNYYSSFLRDMSGGFGADDIQDNSYIKFREVAIGYTFPQKWTERAKVSKLSVSLTARNLFYLYKTAENIDPESLLGTNSWTEYTNYPTSRTYGFNVNITF